MRYAIGIGVALVALAGCQAKETTVLVITQVADGVTVDSLTADVVITGVGTMSQALPASGEPLVLPGHLIVRTPDFAGDVRVTLTATQPGGPTLTSTCSVRSVPLQQVPMTIVLGAPSPMDCQITCASDSPPSPQCWDVGGTFTQLDFPRSDGSTRIFQTKPNLGETVWASLDAEDATYVQSAETCSMMARQVPESWFIERKRKGDAWTITVRGISASDCGRKRATAAGRLAFNGDRGWKIVGSPKCDFTDDATVADTHCTVDVANGTVDFKSGSPCGQCCACADGAFLDIAVDVAQQ